jgi:hypothetical protein
MPPAPTARLSLAVLLLAPALATAQPVPQPFPRPGQRPATEPSAPQAPARPAAVPQPPPAAPGGEEAPTEALLGVPIMPNARFIRSYDAGRGQRYYLFGSLASFIDVVTYYRNVLKQRGELVYDEPPVHMFELGRFREETMAFPPGVTVKDYTWGGYGGYLNPAPGAEPPRWPTIVQIVAVPPADRRQ